MQGNIFHFRDSLLNYVLEKLQELQVDKAAWVGKLTPPNAGKLFPVRLLRARPLRPQLVSETEYAPAVFISYDGGRKEPFERTLIQNIVEVLGIRLEIVLRDEYGTNAGGTPRELSRQVGDAIQDVESLLNHNSFQEWLSQAVNIPDSVERSRFREQAIIVQDVMLTEWGFNEQFRGTPNEVIIAVVQFFMSYPKQ